MANEHVPIRLRTLVPNVPLTFDVYIKLQEKFVLYIRRGDDIELARLRRLQDKNVKQLFILDGDEESYQHFLDKALTEASMENNQMTAVDRAATTSQVASTALEDMHTDPESLATFTMLERAAGGIAKVVGRRTDVLKEFYQMVNASDVDILFKHAMNVASLSTCLAESLKFSAEDIANISVAALLLDVGVVKMPPEAKALFVKRYDEMTNEEWAIYKQHPKIGSELLNGKTYINKQILEMINDHEERKSGEGFPRAITEVSTKLQVIGIAAVYDRMVTCVGYSHKEAMDEVQINQLGNFDLEMIKAFKKLLKTQGVTESA